MRFPRAAHAALAGQTCPRRVWAGGTFLIIVILAGLSLSCGNSYKNSSPNHNAYVTLPATGNVLLLNISGATGEITIASQTPQVLNASTTGLALPPSKKFLYAVNSLPNTISIFQVASDGTLTLTGTPTPAGNGPYEAAVDPSGKYLLVTNAFGSNGDRGDVSVFSIDSGSGALTEVLNSPFPANSQPQEILIAPTGNFVYVSNPSLGTVTAFSFANGVLTQMKTSPVFSGAGATGLAMDRSGRFLYVANPAALNGPPNTNTQGNISAFNIDPTTGALSTLLGSPFTSTGGSGPTLLAVDPGGQFLYATTPGTGDSVWCFTIDSTTGQLTQLPSSPFSVAAGGQFAIFDPTGGYFYIGGSSASAIEGYTSNPATGVLSTLPGSPFSTASSPGKMVFSE
jgi:6-phosphogluconolactonase (cycloisomerase 2 family)